jgi:hypothetical protein
MVPRPKMTSMQVMLPTMSFFIATPPLHGFP